MSGTYEYCLYMNGYSFSFNSHTWLPPSKNMGVQKSTPSKNGRPPQPPHTVSVNTVYPYSWSFVPMQISQSAPDSQAGIRSGTILASAPINTSMIRDSVAPRPPHAPGNMGFRRLPSGMIIFTGRHTPLLRGISESIMQRRPIRIMALVVPTGSFIAPRI